MILLMHVTLTNTKMYQITKSPMLAEVEVSYKSKIKPADRPKLNSSKSTAEYLRSVWNDDRIEHIEEFFIILMNRSTEVIGWCKVSMGGVAGTVCDPKVIFQLALGTNASGIILAHNHPSGSTKPSEQDVACTKALVSAGKVLDIKVFDHIILTAESYFSFGDEGII
jgi:DNA repair protein RadC